MARKKFSTVFVGVLNLRKDDERRLYFCGEQTRYRPILAGKTYPYSVLKPGDKNYPKDDPFDGVGEFIGLRLPDRFDGPILRWNGCYFSPDKRYASQFDDAYLDDITLPPGVHPEEWSICPECQEPNSEYASPNRLGTHREFHAACHPEPFVQYAENEPALDTKVLAAIEAINRVFKNGATTK
jgi:hypothetical protein